MTGTSRTGDARVKIPLLQKVTFFVLQNEIFHKDATHLFCFVCLKLFLTAVIKVEHASNDLF